MTKEAKIKLKKYKDNVVNLYCNDLYIVVLALLTVAFWATGCEIASVYVFLGLSAIYLWLGSDLKPIIAVIMFITMSFSLKQIGSSQFFFALELMLPIIVLSLTYNLIHFRGERHYHKGKLFYGMLTAYVAAILSGLTYSDSSNYWNLTIIGIGLGIYLLYFLCINCTKNNLGTYICKTLYFGGLIVAAQVIIWFIRQPDFMEALMSKSLRVGWGMSNTLAVMFVMATPAIVWLGLKNKIYSYVMFPSVALFLLLLYSTLSRGNILFGTPIICLSTLIGIIKLDKKAVPLTIGAATASAVIVLLVVTPYFDSVIGRLIDNGLDPHGRIELYQRAIRNFMDSPVFGVGYFKPDGLNFTLDGPAVSFIWKTHNTPLQILSCSGIVGVMGMAPYYIQRYSMLLTKFSGFKLISLLAVLGYELEGLVDVTFLSIHQLFFVIGLLAASEIDSYEKQYLDLSIGKKRRSPIRDIMWANNIELQETTCSLHAATSATA